MVKFHASPSFIRDQNAPTRLGGLLVSKLSACCRAADVTLTVERYGNHDLIDIVPDVLTPMYARQVEGWQKVN